MVERPGHRLHESSELKNIEDDDVLVPDDYWIPWTSSFPFAQKGSGGLVLDHCNFSRLVFNYIPTISSLKSLLNRLFVSENAVDSARLIATFWCDKKVDERKRNYAHMIEDVRMLMHSGQVHETQNISDNFCDIPVRAAIVRLDLLADLLTMELVSMKSSISLVPAWRGKAMQFIEFISIGIELDLFEGRNQNEICNALIKAFGVKAESDAPIYKQRFDGLFRSSKKPLPLIASFIERIESKKGIKIQW